MSTKPAAAQSAWARRKSGEHEFGLIVSFETIEHLPDFSLFLDRLHRALKPGGVLVISTPDRDIYARTRPGPNPHHLAELSGEEFRAALASRFPNVKLFGQRVLLCSLLSPFVPDGPEREIAFATLSPAADLVTAGAGPEHVYWLAACSESALPPLTTSLLEPAHRFNPIASLAGGIADRDAEILRLRAELSRLMEIATVEL